jgi:hypothetical protein
VTEMNAGEPAPQDTDAEDGEDDES